MITGTLVAYFLGALIISFLCSLFEATLLSVTPTHIGVLKERGSPVAQILEKLKERVDHPLIAILTLNTVANMFGAAGVGAEVARIVEEKKRAADAATKDASNGSADAGSDGADGAADAASNGAADAVSNGAVEAGSNGVADAASNGAADAASNGAADAVASGPSVEVAVASGLLTLAILIFSEIVPKTLGAVYWKALAPLVALPISILVTVLFPVVRALEVLPRLISRGANTSDVSREEIGVLAEAAGRLGTLRPHERQVIANLLTLSEVRAEETLTPRLEMASVELDETAGEVAADRSRLRHSRIPVRGEDVDDIKGLVLRHDVLYACLDGKPETTMAQLLKPISVVPETATLAKLLERFSVQPGGLREQILLVVNEYGGTEGIITLEDVIETLLGIEILDETDLVADLRQLAERKATIRKRRMNLDE